VKENAVKISLAAAASLAALALVACGGSSSSGSNNGDIAGDDADFTNDACAKPALDAAETEYGNSPDGTKIRALIKGKHYRVTVGIRNPEDGPHDYYVDFASGCSSKPKVTEVPWFPHPLRDASHAVYDKILHANADKMDATHDIPETALPAAAKKQFDTWVSYGTKTCSAVKAYKVAVSGQDTFAVSCDQVGDSIKFRIAIWDSKGGDIDQASTYGLTSGVVDQGVSWQNEEFEQQD
jgi:hypothetical protein